MPVNPLFERLVDDAGLFPPTLLPMADAVARHVADRRGGDPVLTHRFLCPASRLGELRAAVTEPMRLGLILDTDLDTERAELSADPRLTVDFLEVPIGDVDAGAVLGRLPGGIVAYLEPRRRPGWLDVVEKLSGHAGRGAKVRCGGVRPELFPSPGELAAFICACAAASVPFKATAGLHHAVRHTDPSTGFTHHGFLNLVLGVAVAVRGGSAAEVAGTLERADGAGLAAEARAISPEAARATRALLVSYGSCSTSAPRQDLTTLGLVTGE